MHTPEGYEWDSKKAVVNLRKHGVHFADAATVFGDDFAIRVPDAISSLDEDRFVILGTSGTWRASCGCLHVEGGADSHHLGTSSNTAREEILRGWPMKKEYDFSQGMRGAVEPTASGKTRITIRIDNEILDWFRSKVDAQGGGNYQTLMNQALHEFIDREGLEATLRRVLREELGAPTARTARSASS